MAKQHPRGPKTGRSKHPWYWTWLNHRRNMNCPWSTFEEFKRWAEDQGYDPGAGDRIVLNYSRLYGFAPRVRKPGRPDPLLESEPELARSPTAARASALEQLVMVHWRAIMSHCYDAKDPLYERIGGEGIRVCSTWHDFNRFFEWAVRNGGDQCGIELVRRDLTRDYDCNNCVFVEI